MIRPANDWVLLKLDPLEDKKLHGVIVLADSTTNVIRTATVLAVGPGRFAKEANRRTPVPVEKGEKVAFLRWHLEHKNGKQVSSVLDGFDEETALIRAADILFAFPVGESPSLEWIQ